MTSHSSTRPLRPSYVPMTNTLQGDDKFNFDENVSRRCFPCPGRHEGRLLSRLPPSPRAYCPSDDHDALCCSQTQVSGIFVSPIWIIDETESHLMKPVRVIPRPSVGIALCAATCRA